ncbi:myb_DNA-bind_5 domain-containing protein [Trichonephila clavata]|uniref:Regulatory protein zeste n=1 Tax=Trichonephila clavata TaxID=2740835 RepID=A0A8X6KP27_TRICU|nr:myb_DNA-bind_5 domain-containing protein [Trichonephila clavata]
MNLSKIYFTQFEKELVLELMKPHLHIIECKETNAVSSLKKSEAYTEIARQFNDTDGVVNPRTPQKIHQCYLNLKKRMSKKSGILRQERRRTGGGEVPKEAELTDFEMRFLEEPILTLPLYTPFDSDSTEIEISKSPYTPSTSNSASLIPPVSLQSTDKITEYDCSSDPSNAGMDTSKPTPKIERPLKETLSMFRKRGKKATAPSAAARAAACIEHEHRLNIKHMEEEHKLRMELLRAQIEVQNSLLATLKDNHTIILQKVE